MQITRIRIENYRSIKSIEIAAQPLCVIIGENNCGKTNILRALSLVLGDAWPSERSFSEGDFHQFDTKQDILIQVFFDQEWEHWRNKHNFSVAGFELTVHALLRRSGNKQKGDLAVDFVCIDSKGKRCTYPDEALIAGSATKARWLDAHVTSDDRARAPLLYIGALREYRDHSASGRWSLLRKLFNEVNIDFQTSQDKIPVPTKDGKTEKVLRREAFHRYVGYAQQLLRTDAFKRVETSLVQNVREQMGFATDADDIGLTFETFDPSHAYKNVNMIVDEGGVKTLAEEVGSGLQSAIVLGILRTYEEISKTGAFFAIEEPEAFLHPHKIRHFRAVLERIAAKGNQVFVSTHSPFFVSLSNPESVILVSKHGTSGTKCKQVDLKVIAPAAREELKLVTEFDVQRSELLFARKVLLVEGNTEKVVYPQVFKKLDADIDRLGISIISCGGKSLMTFMARIAGAFEVPYIAVADNDLVEISESWEDDKRRTVTALNEQHVKLNEALEQLVPDGRLFWCVPNMDRELGLPSDTPNKVAKALERVRKMELAQLPPVLRGPVEALLSM
jgi:putative ATP-dependent endonuclease of the OLD family